MLTTRRHALIALCLGTLVLQPTENLIFFPRMLKLAAGEERKIRVGLAANATKPDAPNVVHKQAPVETSYRIIVQELPSRKTAADRSQIQVLARMSIPIFVTPKNAKAKTSIEAAMTQGNKLIFQMKNTGTASTMVNELYVTAFDAKRRELLKTKLTSWYLLANDTRSHEFALPETVCPKVHSFLITAKTTEKTIEQPYVPSHPLSCTLGQANATPTAPAMSSAATPPNASIPVVKKAAGKNKRSKPPTVGAKR